MGNENDNVLARITFKADKVLPKMKKCLDKKDILHVFKHYPALELQTGLLIASTGHILAAHKLQGYRFCPEDCVMLSSVLPLPVEVLTMKGTVTVEVISEEGKTFARATDEQGATYMQESKGRYPNWRSVIPRTTGSPIGFDAKAWEATLKGIVPQMDTPACGVRLCAKRGDDKMTLRWDVYNEDVYREGREDVSVEYVPFDLVIRFNAKMMRDLMAFRPTTVRFVEVNSAVLFTNDETVMLLMPLHSSDGEGHCRINKKVYDTFNLDEWIGADLGEVVVDNTRSEETTGTGTGTGTPKVKSLKPETVKPETNREPTMAERLRAALLKIQQAA